MENTKVPEVVIKPVAGSHRIGKWDNIKNIFETLLPFILQVLPIMALIFIDKVMGVRLGYTSYVESINTIVLVGAASIIYEKIDYRFNPKSELMIIDRFIIVVMVFLICWSLLSFSLLILCDKDAFTAEMVPSQDILSIAAGISVLLLIIPACYQGSIKKGFAK